MDVLQQLRSLAPMGYEVLTQLHRHSRQCSVEELAAEVGLPITLTKRMLRTYSILGPRLRDAEGLSIFTLEVVAKSFAAVKDGNKEQLQQLVEQAKGCATTEEATRVLRHTVNRWNKAVPRKPDTLYFQRTPGLDGKRQVLGRLSAERVAAMERILHPMVARIRKANPEVPYACALATALFQKVTAPAAGGPVSPSPAFLIPLTDQYHYFADGKIASADGALHDLAAVTDQALAPTGYACVVAKDEQEIPQLVGVLPVQRADQEPATVGRLATMEQRRGAILETLTCAHPDCVVPALHCEVHHIQAWSHGGPTTNPNLTMLCRVHNGRNDDDPARPKNGRIEREPTTGTPGWVRRQGDPVRTSQSPLAEKGWRHWALGVYRRSSPQRR